MEYLLVTPIYTLGIGLLFIVESCLLLGVSVSGDARCINIEIKCLELN